MHELSGTVKVIFEEQTFASGFNKIEFVVTDDADKYPQSIKFECVKDKVELVNKLTVGDKVKVTFDLRGNEYNGKYYVNLAAWKVETLAAAPTGAAATPPAFDPADDALLEDVPF
jgi:hypothetical protein